MTKKMRVTREVRKYDKALYCDYVRPGVLAIFRKTTSWEYYLLDDSTSLAYAKETPWFVFAFTEDGRTASEPREWGVLRILEEIRRNDTHHRDVVGDILSAATRRKESQERDMRNKNEAFARYELRDSFRKSADNMNLSQVDKASERRIREKQDNKIKGVF